MGARLVKVTGEVQRNGAVIHVVATKLEDMTSDLDILSDDELPEVVAHADHVKSPLPSETGISKRNKNEKDMPIPLARADEVVKPQHERNGWPHYSSQRKGHAEPLKKPKRVTTPARGTHPRNVRIIPKSRDFH